MEKFPLSQKESGVNRVVGFESDKEEEFLQYFKNKFETNSLDSKEKDKTPEQQGLIERMNHEMRDFLAQYGVGSIEVPTENIHILDKSKFTEEELKKIQLYFGTENGFYSALKQGVAIIKDYDVSKLSFFQTLAHELLHLQGFYSYQKSKQAAADLTLEKQGDSVSMNIRRSGFSIGTTDGKRLLFHKLNESVITELEIRFEKTYMVDWPELELELQARDKYIEQFARRESVPIEKVGQIVAGIKDDGASGRKWVSYAYHEERQQFNSLVDALYEKNKGDFKSREGVFRLFAEATMKGRLLPVARLIEKTFGKGSFGIIGERSADKPNREEPE
ncbi:hypothetical protein KC722_01960 [Candidatus Kaiserbacteria bacterium]|nr:hypothetical protein [Candidatus Kaiserbacteria bacterium]MCB9811480.1 hypothetical protein [Candidatus Nomurabacteria bacterium]